MKIEPLNKSKKKKFLETFSNFGKLKTNSLLLKTGKEKVRAFTGDLSNEELMALWRLFPVEGVGLYIGKETVDKKSGRKEARLSLDGLHFFGDQIKEDVLVLDEKQTEGWFRGENVELGDCSHLSNLRADSLVSKGSPVHEEREVSKGLMRGRFVAVSDGEDLIGTAKISNDGKVLVSFLPKERRRRENG